ncbi:MAG: BCCT family transporter [Pseudomonadota bacterium]
MKPAITDLEIKTADTGFYAGFNRTVTFSSKLIIGGLIVWAVAFPEQAGETLGALNGFLMANFAAWYIYAMAFFIIVCAGLALWPAFGSLKLGHDDDEPEFSSFSWFSMMFGAGIGIGMLTFATAEPIYHFQNNPDVIRGITEGSTAENVRPAYKWSFTHWGFAAWASYAIVGLSLAYFAYRRDLPLTIRSGLTPLFGRSLSGTMGHVVDVVAVVATVLGVAQTLGFGVDQFVAGLARIGVGDWLLTADGQSTTMAIVVALGVIMGASTLSALSGVGNGIRILSNINMVLSFGLLAFFLVFGSTLFALQALGYGILDYVVGLPQQMFEVWKADGTEQGDALSGWQNGWTVFYWAWWIAFAPFVGVFLARISKGRTIREYVLGAIMVPSLMCFVWFTMVGGTAINLELTGVANNEIIGAGQADQLFAMLAVMLDEQLAWIFSVLVVVLLLTYLVTSADSAVLIVNTINAAGDEGPKARPHIVFWGAALALVVGALLMIGGLKAIQTAMIIGALPFSAVMVLMGFALIKAVIKDGMRSRRGLATTYRSGAAPAE